MHPNKIYHLLTADELALARQVDPYAPASLLDDSVGYVHASFAEQVVGTYQRFYADCADVWLLQIDTDKLSARLKVEDTLGHGAEFPHIYGPIPWDAVIEVISIADFIDTIGSSNAS